MRSPRNVFSAGSSLVDATLFETIFARALRSPRGESADAGRTALGALVNRQPAALAGVMSGDDRLDHLQIDIDDGCFMVIVRYHPVASDFRVIVSALKINTDFERVGDVTVNIR